MKKEKELVLKLNELPQRTEKLDPEQTLKILGGCSDTSKTCFVSQDCCNYPYDICESFFIGGTCQPFREQV